jgi:hypothetical protein
MMFINSTHAHRFRWILGILLPFLISSCYTIQWSNANFTQEKTHIVPNFVGMPEKIGASFKNFHKKVMEMPVQTPGENYNYDISEKDPFFANDRGKLAFDWVQFIPCDAMPQGEALVDIYFFDKFGNYLKLKKVDLLRITPKIDSKGDMQYAEYILEEFSRFGVQFRKEHDEYELVIKTDEPALKEAAERAYRVDLVNNCLDPMKWELQFTSEDFTGFKKRKKSKTNYNQERMLSHGWFWVDKTLYEALLITKNPTVDPALFAIPYDSLSNVGQSTVVNFDALRRPIRSKIHTKMLEVGHKTNRIIEPVDTETGYKKSMGLLGGDTIGVTYASLLEKPVNLAAFVKEGFYTPEEPRIYDLNYLKYVDDIDISIIDVQGSDCYVEIKIGGPNAYYTFTMGNIDLATLDEQRLYGINNGINLYPKSRRYNPFMSTLTYDVDLTPEDRKSYFLMTETASGKWVNNQWKGVEKAYLGFNKLNPNVLDVYLLSYEREMPVWYGQVKINGAMREKIRARRSMYNF